jgi:DNA polymerase-1
LLQVLDGNSLLHPAYHAVATGATGGRRRQAGPGAEGLVGYLAGAAARLRPDAVIDQLQVRPAGEAWSLMAATVYTTGHRYRSSRAVVRGTTTASVVLLLASTAVVVSSATVELGAGCLSVWRKVGHDSVWLGWRGWGSCAVVSGGFGADESSSAS